MPTENGSAGSMIALVIASVIVVAATVGLYQYYMTPVAGFEDCSAKIEPTRPYDYNYMKTLYKGKDCGCGCDGMMKAVAAKKSIFSWGLPAPAPAIVPPVPTVDVANFRGMSANPDGAVSSNTKDPRVLMQTSVANDTRVVANDISRELALQRQTMSPISPAANIEGFVSTYSNRAASTGKFLERDPVNSHQDSGMNVPNLSVLSPSGIVEGNGTVSEFRGMRTRPYAGKKM